MASSAQGREGRDEAGQIYQNRICCLILDLLTAVDKLIFLNVEKTETRL
jgi:hypothetical protein